MIYSQSQSRNQDGDNLTVQKFFQCPRVDATASIVCTEFQEIIGLKGKQVIELHIELVADETATSSGVGDSGAEAEEVGSGRDLELPLVGEHMVEADADRSAAG